MEKNASLTELFLKILNNCLAHFKLCMAIVCVPTLAMFVLVMWVLKPTFVAEAVVTPPNAKSGLSGSFSKLLDGAGFSSVTSLFGSSEQGIDVVWTFLSSWELHSQVIEKFDLKNRYKMEDAKFHADVLKQFRKNLSIDMNDENMFAIEFEDEDPKVAVEVVQFVLEKADSMYNSFKTTQARQSRQYMDARLAEVEQVIDSLLDAFSKFQAENDFYDPEVQVEATMKYLSTLQTERDGVMLELSYEKMQRGDNTKRYNELSKQLKTIDASISKALKGDRSSVGVLPLKKAPELGTQYMRFETEIKIQQAIYKLLREQSEQLRLEEVNMQTNLVILSPPWENDKKVFPKRGAILVFTVLLTGVFAVCLACFLEYWKRERNGELLTERERLSKFLKRGK